MNTYEKYIIENMPRVLTQVDRDINSKTYGSCDRNYWHLKIRDFSSAILQQTCLTLALAYKYNFEGNIYYKNPKVREWSIAALKYMGKIQLKDGSFNEYYPNEHGFPPTAFCLFAGSMTYMELELEDQDVLQTLCRAAEWLGEHVEQKALNQELASIVGMYLYYLISNDEKVFKKMQDKLRDILTRQSSEGWFMEQGGADIGYLSVSLDMLSEYYRYSKDSTVVEPIHKMVDFLQYFVHQDGTVGGEYGSRNTIYFMPNGLENVIGMKMGAAGIAAALKKKIYIDWDKKNHFMDSVDERYLAHYVMHSYLRANRNSIIRESMPIAEEEILPCERPHYKVFKEAGLVSVSDGDYHIIIAPSKGGIIKLYYQGEERYIDCGYRSVIKEGVIATTNWLNPDWKVTYDEFQINILGKFSVVKQKVQNPIYHLGLRMGALLLGDKVNRIVKKLTIFSNNKTDIKYERQIKFEDNAILICDKIESPKDVVIYTADNVSLRLVASGKFFSISDLLPYEYKLYNGKNINIDRKYSILDNREIYL